MRVLFLDLDSLRADHLGCYGYHRNTSPNIDRIAAQGVRFTNYYCSDAPCLPSRTALMTGRFGIHSGVVGHGGTAADLRPEGAARGFQSTYTHSCLPRIFRREGMTATSISPFAERHSAWWFYAGFTEMLNTGLEGMESAEQVTPVVTDWLERNARRDDWLLHINYWDPHTPYRVPEDFGNPFANDSLPAWLTPEVFARHLEHIGPHSANEIMMYHSDAPPKYPRHPGALKGMEDLRRMIDGYDCGVRYMDEHIGRIFDSLADAGVLDDTVIIISADHGENLGELGIYGEHATADAITCRTPLIVRWPGMKSGHVDEGLHYQLDFAPTLAELLGQESRADWDGESFAPAIRDGVPCGREELILSQCAHVCQRSVRFGNWLYLRTYHDGYHLFPEEMLFDLVNDPHEDCNLAAERPEILAEGARRLERWHGEMMASQPGLEDPMESVLREGGPEHARGYLSDYCKRLEATGRGWAVPELKRRHPGEFPNS